MNKQIKCVLSLVMAIVILALFLPTVSIAADNSSAANTALQNENSIKEDSVCEGDAKAFCSACTENLQTLIPTKIIEGNQS